MSASQHSGSTRTERPRAPRMAKDSPSVTTIVSA